MDLTMLAKLPYERLVEEAERRGITDAEWKDRAALERAIVSHAERHGDPDAKPRSPLERARRLIGRVVSGVRAAVISSETSAGSSNEETSLAPARPSADLESGAAEVEPAPLTSPSSPPPVTATLVGELTSAASRLEDPAFGGLEVVRGRARHTLVWRARPEEVAAARLLLAGAAGSLSLRTVAIGCAIGDPLADVFVHTEELPDVGAEGVRVLELPRAQHVLLALGVRHDDRFVSIAHAKVA